MVCLKIGLSSLTDGCSIHVRRNSGRVYKNSKLIGSSIDEEINNLSIFVECLFGCRHEFIFRIFFIQSNSLSLKKLNRLALHHLIQHLESLNWYSYFVPFVSKSKSCNYSKELQLLLENRLNCLINKQAIQILHTNVIVFRCQ